MTTMMTMMHGQMTIGKEHISGHESREISNERHIYFRDEDAVFNTSSMNPI